VVRLHHPQHQLARTGIYGATADLKRRLPDHNAGKSAHTAKLKPWALVWYLCSRTNTKRSNSRDTSNLTRVGRLPRSVFASLMSKSLPYSAACAIGIGSRASQSFMKFVSQARSITS
jgi:hypothetical protein